MFVLCVSLSLCVWKDWGGGVVSHSKYYLKLYLLPCINNLMIIMFTIGKNQILNLSQHTSFNKWVSKSTHEHQQWISFHDNTERSKPGYLDSFPCEPGSGGSTLKRPGLVQLDETFVILKSYSSCNSRTSWASVDLRTRLNPLKSDTDLTFFVLLLGVRLTIFSSLIHAAALFSF